MNTTELLDYISARTTIVVQPTNRKEKYPGIVEYTVGILKKTGPGFAQINNLSFLVLNEGVVAGPQTYANDVFDDSEPPVLIHAAGDPVLDGEGNQIVIAPEDAEQAWIPGEPPADPVFRDQAVAWLASALPAAYVRFDVESTDEAEKTLVVKAVKVIDATTCSEVRVIAWQDGGAPQWREIV